MMRTGSPGTRWISKLTAMVTTQRVNNPESARRAMYDPMRLSYDAMETS